MDTNQKQPHYSFNVLKILPLIFALFIDNLSFGSVYPLITGMFKNHPEIFFSQGVDGQQVDFYLGLAYLLFPLGMFFGASILGDLSDFIGRKKTLIWCMAGVGIGFFVMTIGTVIGSLALFLIGRLVTGLMAGSQPIAQASIVDVSDEKSKTMNMSFITFAVILGVAFGPVLGGFFADRDIFKDFGFYLPLLIIGVIAIGAAVWIGISFNPIEKKVDVRKAITPWRPITIFVEALRHQWIRTLVGVFFIFQIGFGIYFQFMLVKLQQEFQFSVFEMGLFTGFLGVCFMIALLLVMRWMVRIACVEYLCVMTAFINGIAILISGYMHSLSSIFILAAIVGMMDIFAYTTLLTSFSNAVEKDKQGWALGIATSAMALAWLVSGLFSNVIPEIGINNVIGLGGLLVIVSSFMMWRYCTSRRLSFK